MEAPRVRIDSGVAGRRIGKRRRPSLQTNLVRLKVRSDGRLLAQAAGNAPVGRTAEFARIARKAQRRIDNALELLADGGFRDDFVRRLKDERGLLRRAHTTHRSGTIGPKAPVPSGLLLNPEERSSSVRAASAGLPSLGKRR
jgi:hypothetical protein